MILKIFDGNVRKALDDDHKPLLKGYGLGRDGKVYLEYMTDPASRRRQVITATTGGATPIITHNCKSLEGAPKPCWHLGAIALAMPGSTPFQVNIERFQPSPGQIVKDMTEGILGRPGDFELLELVEDDSFVPEYEEYPTLSGEDSWLLKYNLPVRVLKKVLAFRDKQKENLTEEQLSRIPKAKYIPSGNEFINAVASLMYGSGGKDWEAPLLIGPKGSGKSTMAESLAAVLMLPVNKIFGGIDLNAETLLGARTLVPSEDLDVITESRLRAGCKAVGIESESLIQRLRGSQMKVGFDPGTILQAVQNGEMVLIDEVNMLIAEVTSLLHGLLDWQKCLTVPGFGTIKAPESFRLCACMNFGYSGTKTLNEAFQDRFRSVQVPHLSSKQLADLIILEIGCKESTAEKLSFIFGNLAEGVKGGNYDEKVLSIRALFRIAREEIDGCGSLKAIAVSVLTEGLNDKFEADQIRDLVEACIKE